MSINWLSNILLSVSAETITQPADSNNMSNVIGIGGIIATVIVGLVSCIVTWKISQKSIKQNRLSYSSRILNILSSSIDMQNSALNNLVISLNNQPLKNPCLLLIEIENTGSEAIINPPIYIKVDDSTTMFPGYIQDIPAGYESKWLLNKIDDNCCNIVLDHINVGQKVKACFFIDNSTDKIGFECPMPNVDIHEKTEHITENHTVFKGRFGRIEKVTTALLICCVLLVISSELWAELFYQIFRPYAPFGGVILFVFSTLVLSILLNVFGMKKFDKFICKIKKAYKWIFIFASLAISLLLTYMVLFNIIIISFFTQTIIMGIVVIVLSLTIHILSIED